MNEAKEITVLLKDSEKRINHKFLIYDVLEVSSDSDIIRDCIDKAKKLFDCEPETIRVTVKLEVQ